MIVDVALLVVGAIAVSELFMRLPMMEQARIIVSTARRSAATVRSSRISDHWKETVLRAYSARLAGRSFYFFLLLCLAVLPVAAVGVAAPGGMTHWFALLMRPFAIAIMSACSILYIFARTRLARG